MTMRLVDDRKLTKVLNDHYKAGCHICDIHKKCYAMQNWTAVPDWRPPTKRACFKALREFLTPGEEK